MTKDIFMLKAFAAGADAVIILVCPEGACRYSQGNLRAKKRVTWVQERLTEIGLDGKRLSLHNVIKGDTETVSTIVGKILETLKTIGPNPAKP